MEQPEDTFDVVVVGGGPAGLSAALLLSRARRRVIVIDDGRPRNVYAAHMHGVLGHDGLPPLRLLELGRREIAGYGGRFEHGTVAALMVRGGAVDVARRRETRFRARRALVATGLSDDLPDIPGIRDQWGRGAVVCPYCDGWEHRLDVIGVIATSPRSVEQAQLLRQWSERVVYFPGAFGEPDAEDAAALADRGIRIELGEIAGLRVDRDRLTGVELGDRVVPVGVVFVGTRLEAP